MISLFIDGQRVNLSKNAKFEFFDRNPLFSKEGQHTLDIDIDLGDPQNAMVYKHLHRIDVAKRPYGRPAMLYSERGIIIRGTEIVLEIDDKKAKIQIVSGNSELNYLSGGDQSVRDLDLGTIENLNRETAWASNFNVFSDYCCPPVCVKNTFYYSGTDLEIGYNDEHILYNDVWPLPGDIGFAPDVILCPQPYLHAIVRRIVEALGYTMRRNFLLDDPALRKLIVVNGYHTPEYSKMLPDICIDDFLTMLENFTGCVIVVDQAEKVVDILQKNYFYDNASVEEIAGEDVIGDITRKYDQDSPDNLLYHNVRYDFPKSETYNYWALDPDLMKTIAVERCPDHSANHHDSSFTDHFYNVWQHLNDGQPVPLYTSETIQEKYNRSVAYIDPAFPDNNLVVMRSKYNKEKNNKSLLRMINQYGGHYDKRTDDEMVLKMMPAEIVWAQYIRLHEYMGYLPYLFARCSDIENPESTDDDTKGLNEFIAGEEQPSQTSDRIYLAFYIGMQNANWLVETKDTVIVPAPTAVPSSIVEAFTHINNSDYDLDIFAAYRTVMRKDYGLPGINMFINGSDGMYERYYKNQLNINFTQPVTIKFKSLSLRDSRKLFVIGNQRFFCQELKHVATAGSLSDVIEGTFFQVLDDVNEGTDENSIKITALVQKDTNTVTFMTDKPLPCGVKFTFRARTESGSSSYAGPVSMEEGATRIDQYIRVRAYDMFAITDIIPDVLYTGMEWTTEIVVSGAGVVKVTITYDAANSQLVVTASETLQYSLQIAIMIETPDDVQHSHTATIAAGTDSTTVAINYDPTPTKSYDRVAAITSQDSQDTNYYRFIFDF